MDGVWYVEPKLQDRVNKPFRNQNSVRIVREMRKHSDERRSCGRTHQLDPIGQGILHILSRYESLYFLELWYEIGEDDGLKGQVSKEALLNRLESLMARGFVERIREAEGTARWALKREKSSDNPAGY
jgi:DNA-binding HxlR family transcriptional regulator